MAKAKKILVVLTNQATYGADQEKTGLWLAEATEFIAELSEAGYTLDYVSPRGGAVPLDPRSLKLFYARAQTKQILADPDFQQRALTDSLCPEQVVPSDYAAIYYTGGHGVVWDFPNNKQLQDIASSIYQQGGFVSSVCHGLAGLLNLRDGSGQYLIAGKTITGFTQAEEILSGKVRKVPFSTEKEALRRGALFNKKFPFSSFAIRDGQLITGQNPMSGRAVAQELLKALES